jgi:predicted branched-subunit amino acid permease
MPSPQLAEKRRGEVLRQCLSVGLATGAYGISFGALSVAAGLDLWQTMALSALLFSGASQFAVVGIIAAGGSGAAAVATSSLLGLRNGLYGLQISRLLRVRGLGRVPAAHLTIDESTAVAIAQPEPAAQRLGFWGTGLSVFVLWNLSTLLGAVVGNALGDPKRYGLDAAAPAAFCALLWPRLKTGDTRAVAAAAAVIALIVAPHAPAGIPVLVAALAAVVAGVIPSRGQRDSKDVNGPGTSPGGQAPSS